MLFSSGRAFDSDERFIHVLNTATLIDNKINKSVNGLVKHLVGIIAAASICVQINQVADKSGVNSAEG